jgi:hypothetical protein
VRVRIEFKEDEMLNESIDIDMDVDVDVDVDVDEG